MSILEKWKKKLTPTPVDGDVVHPIKFEDSTLWDKEVVMHNFLNEFDKTKDLIIIYNYIDDNGKENVGYTSSTMNHHERLGMLVGTLMYMGSPQ